MKLLFTDTAVATSGIKDIQVLKTATIYDSRYGQVKITEEMIDQMILNFDEKVRGIEIMLDAGHNSDKEAYGWFKKLYKKLSEDGKSKELWATVELTPIGQRALTEKLYGYISADFEVGYKDNETLKNHGAVLLGAALTNRPVVKRMKPAIELSENEVMTIEEMLQACGVQSAEELIAQFNELKGKGQSAEEMQAQLSQAKMELSEKETNLTQLTEKLSAFEKAAEETKKTNEFNALMSEGKAVEAQREAFMKGDMIEYAKNAAMVKLSEKAHGEEGNDEDVESKIMKLAEAHMKESKLGITHAIAKVLSDNPELNKQYNEKMRGGK